MSPDRRRKHGSLKEDPPQVGELELGTSLPPNVIVQVVQKCKSPLKKGSVLLICYKDSQRQRCSNLRVLYGEPLQINEPHCCSAGFPGFGLGSMPGFGDILNDPEILVAMKVI